MDLEVQVSDNICHKSKRKLRWIGFLDATLTVALLIQVTCCVLFPLLKVQKIFDFKNYPEGEEPANYSYLIITSFSMSVLTATIDIMASTALCFSTCSNIDCEPRLEMIGCWMRCNIIVTFMVTVEFVVVLLLHIFGSPVGPPIPTLMYLAFRLIVTLIVYSDTMSAHLVELLEEELIEKTRARYREIKELPSHECMQLEFRAVNQPPELPLSPYGRGGFSLPSCQCLASRTV